MYRVIVLAKGIIEAVKAIRASSYKEIMACETTFCELKNLVAVPFPRSGEMKGTIPTGLMNARSEVLILPTSEYLTPQLPHFDATPEELKNHKVYKPNPVMIKSFDKEYNFMPSKEKPKRIKIKGSDGKDYFFLLKNEELGDSSKEAKFINCIEAINHILKSDKECAKRNLQLQTYKIIPLSSSGSIIEWVMNTEPIRAIVLKLWSEHCMQLDIGDIRNACEEVKIKNATTGYWKIWYKIQEMSKPVLYRWFLEQFPSGDAWYNGKLNFTRTCAVWSMVGHIIGLGDRHADNILLNRKTGEVINVDFDCIFEKGKDLKIPELVPFRLTRNFVDAFGIFHEKTEFVITCNVVLNALYKNRESIITNLESFVHDPLYESSHNTPVNPTKAISQVRAKLEECAKGTKELVQRLICQATNEETLKRMFIGWMPWL